jgi:hypothetical protein
MVKRQKLKKRYPYGYANQSFSNLFETDPLIVLSCTFLSIMGTHY